MIIQQYGIELRSVREEDAEFIMELRTDEKLGRFISATSSDINKQRDWIKQYVEREEEGIEYYFLAKKDGVSYGTTRIYNIDTDAFEVGSWVFSRYAPSGIAILADITAREFAFDRLNVPFCKFEVRKENFSVVRYHRNYHPELIGEDEQNYYFKLSQDNFEKYKKRLLKTLLR